MSLRDEYGTADPPSSVLVVVFDLDALDYARVPGVDEGALRARQRAAAEELRAVGPEVVLCPVPPNPDQAERMLRAVGGDRHFEVVLVGAGLRMLADFTLLFERVVNVLVVTCPGAQFCFNTSPEDTAAALRRWVRGSTMEVSTSNDD